MSNNDSTATLHALNSAALSGDAQTFNRTSVAMMAILGCLRDEDISDFRREGLLIALDGIASDLSARGEFIEKKSREEAA